MRFLITGGAGFIGTALSNALVRGGHVVRVLDDLSSGDPSRLDQRVHFTRGDVEDVPKLWSLLQNVDCVYHLAARVSVQESVLYPRDYNSTNVGGTVSLMTAMRDAGIGRVVLTSSGAVYGEQAVQPLREDGIPNPSSPYAVSKLAAEYYLHTIGTLWGIETVALRIFNAYGPGQYPRAAHPPVIPSIVKQALGGGSIVVHGNGKQTRDFVYVDDVVAALVTAAHAGNVNRLTINVGAGVASTIDDVVNTVGHILGKDLSPLHVTADSGGVSRMCAELSRAHERLAYEPQVNLEQGLKAYIASLPAGFSR
jgi:UDP-glucose 4-epimerase